MESSAISPSTSDRLACDCVVISDGGQFAPGVPAVTYGLRGIAYYELRIKGPNRDLHSGSFGGSVTNPANALAKILAGLIDDKGRITIPGFYDDVVPLTERERKEMAALPFDEKEYFQRIGVSQGVGEAGYTTLERRWSRPTFDTCGLWSGYQGEGGEDHFARHRRREDKLSHGAQSGFGQDYERAEEADCRVVSARHRVRIDRLARWAGRGSAAG